MRIVRMFELNASLGPLKRKSSVKATRKLTAVKTIFTHVRSTLPLLLFFLASFGHFRKCYRKYLFVFGAYMLQQFKTLHSINRAKFISHKHPSVILIFNYLTQKIEFYSCMYTAEISTWLPFVCSKYICIIKGKPTVFIVEKDFALVCQFKVHFEVQIYKTNLQSMIILWYCS